eukprot:g12687.t3
MDQSSLSVIERLRWVTLGQQYDWSSRSYLSDERPLPELLELLRLAGEIHSMPRFQAAICNLYHAARRPSDRLGGHRDDVEEDATSPLVTISIGLPSGSMLVLTKRARQAFHGVPSIFVPPKLQLKGRSFRPATACPPRSWRPSIMGRVGSRCRAWLALTVLLSRFSLRCSPTFATPPGGATEGASDYEAAFQKRLQQVKETPRKAKAPAKKVKKELVLESRVPMAGGRDALLVGLLGEPCRSRRPGQEFPEPVGVELFLDLVGSSGAPHQRDLRVEDVALGPPAQSGGSTCAGVRLPFRFGLLRARELGRMTIDAEMPNESSEKSQAQVTTGQRIAPIAAALMKFPQLQEQGLEILQAVQQGGVAPLEISCSAEELDAWLLHEPRGLCTGFGGKRFYAMRELAYQRCVPIWERNQEKDIEELGLSTSDRAACAGRREVVYPIHAAALNGCPRLLQLMLGAGADPDQKTSFGRKALDLVEEAHFDESHSEVLEILRQLQDERDVRRSRDFASQGSRDSSSSKLSSLKQQDYLKNFLRANDFPTVHSSRAAAFQGVEEMVYPIHGAAILGCPRLLRLILLAGGDPLQATEPSGRRPIDLAREVNREGSHDEVLELLSSEVKVLHLRDAMALMRQTTPETPKSTRRCRSTRVSL